MSLVYIDSPHLEIVHQVLNAYHQDFYIFGSRSKGNHRPLSDLDIVSKGSLTKVQASEIKEKFEESNLPYKVDLVLWDEIDENFRQKISPDLKKIDLAQLVIS